MGEAGYHRHKVSTAQVSLHKGQSHSKGGEEMAEQGQEDPVAQGKKGRRGVTQVWFCPDPRGGRDSPVTLGSQCLDLHNRDNSSGVPEGTVSCACTCAQPHMPVHQLHSPHVTSSAAMARGHQDRRGEAPHSGQGLLPLLLPDKGKGHSCKHVPPTLAASAPAAVRPCIPKSGHSGHQGDAWARWPLLLCLGLPVREFLGDAFRIILYVMLTENPCGDTLA